MTPHPSQLNARQRRKLHKKPRLPVTVYLPKKGVTIWTLAAQGYKWHSRTASLQRITDPAPDGYLEARRREHDQMHAAFIKAAKEAKRVRR